MELLRNKIHKIKIYFKKRFRLYEPCRKYDKKGNLVYKRNSDGYEAWAEYYYKENEIFFKDTFGFNIRVVFDVDGSLLCGINSVGLPYFLEFEENVIISAFLKDSFYNRKNIL